MPMTDSLDSWCPECGPLVPFADDGTCSMCGSTCVGKGVERALLAIASEASVEDILNVEEALRTFIVDHGDGSPKYTWATPDVVRSMERVANWLDKVAQLKEDQSE